ncbi:MAG: hypothetical protein U0792_01605 [Gemmataceae bacterium]
MIGTHRGSPHTRPAGGRPTAANGTLCNALLAKFAFLIGIRRTLCIAELADEFTATDGGLVRWVENQRDDEVGNGALNSPPAPRTMPNCTRYSAAYFGSW